MAAVPRGGTQLVSATLHDASDLWALRAAARRAARGLARRRGAAAFLADLDTECLRLQRELREGRYQPGAFHHFAIRDPKPRRISVAPFRDRVVHHAVCAVMEPTFEAYADPDSYACRVGKGTLAAIQRAQVLARGSPWFAKLDVHHCFETADVARLSGRLAEAFEDPALLAVVDRILRAGTDDQGRGLPIGNLTSQHFANFMLGVLDLRARAAGAQGYVRYMDDILVFGASKEQVTGIAESLADAMARDLNQREKLSARRIAPTSAGVPCLGFRIWPHLVRFDGPRRRRFLRHSRAIEHAREAGWLGDADAAVRGAALVAWARFGNTLRFRQALWHSPR